ncbi:hypothetical protein BWZ20_09960 [Winogradskyella sp. J14-2]|uniref:hypothetical protein n=1 Tax=Winogradskyella sp. J14-2 TaxID=1936080 RepID=UPI000972E1CF|nr:hypothetical protein [Winogradskyella sp. J14-2]APY08605.1 hypothetical protein BWZ20_09960 [Winogradskyella sp. J14-2]
MKLSFVFIISLIIQFSFGQINVLNYTINTKNSRTKKTTYSLVNSDNNNFAFLILDRKEIHANLFDENFNAISSFTFKAPKKKFSDPIGYAIDRNTYHLLYANDYISQIALVSVDFDNTVSTTHDLEFKLDDDELYIDTLIYNNELLFITIKDNDLIIRKLQKDKSLKVIKTISIKQQEKKGFVLKATNTFSLFRNQIEASNFVKIDHRIPTSIEQASSPNKIFKFYNQLIVSIDIEKKGTITYSVDLNTFEVEQHAYAYPKGKIDDFEKFNSFICDDKVFQIASSRKEMSFNIKDLNNTVLKEFYLHKDKPITFKNGPIIQEGQTAIPFKTTRQLEATSKFLRKVSSGKIGVSVIKVDDLYEITIGGYKLVPTSNTGFGMTPTTTFDSNTNTFVPAFNPTFSNFYSYSTTKATFFDTVLSENFEHIKKEFEPGLSNMIDSYMVDYKGITGEDIFFHNNTPYYAYFNLKEKQFSLIRF